MCEIQGGAKKPFVHFKVNNKKTIRDTIILFLDSETTTWEVLNRIVFKRISFKWWPLFAWCLRAERLGDCKTDRLTASMFSGVPEVRGRPQLFFRHTSRFPEVLNSLTTEWIFGPVLGPVGGFGSEYGTHAVPLR